MLVLLLDIITIKSMKKGEFYWIERGIILCSQIAKDNGYDEVSITDIILPTHKRNGSKYPIAMIENCIDKGFVVIINNGYKLTTAGYEAYQCYLRKPSVNETNIDCSESKIISINRLKQAKNEEFYSCDICNSRLILPVLMGGIVDRYGNIKHTQKRKICATCYQQELLHMLID